MARTCKVLAVLLSLTLATAACGSDDESGSSTATTGADGRAGGGPACAEGEIAVAAAASLTESFEQVGRAYEAACEGSQITFTFDSSGTLSTQILEGAPVDVFASADEANVEKVAELQAGDEAVFARNQLVIVTQPGNPAGVQMLADLAGAGIVALCAEDAPCGRFAADALEGAGVTLDEGSVTRGQNAKATLAAVAEGDAVAGIVYVTDAAAAAGTVDAVEIPDDQNVIATYPVVAIEGPGDDALAAAFVAYLLSDEAQAVLADAGFLAP